MSIFVKVKDKRDNTTKRIEVKDTNGSSIYVGDGDKYEWLSESDYNNRYEESLIEKESDDVTMLHG